MLHRLHKVAIVAEIIPVSLGRIININWSPRFVSSPEWGFVHIPEYFLFFEYCQRQAGSGEM